MKINTLIIGSGFLSNNLKKKIINSQIYTANQFIKKINLINKKKNKVNLIINSFFSSKKLVDLNSYEKFVKKTIFEIAKILDKIDSTKINKIIYTSSSSVYGILDNDVNLVDDNNRNIYAGFKVAAENLIKNYSNKRAIPLFICRIFNMYGKKNEFSIVDKLIKAKKNNYKIEIYNNGLSVRDFIHVEDVVKIYLNFLKKKSRSGLYDVGTGKGLSLIQLLKKLRFPKKNIVYQKKKINEISVSIANNKILFQKYKIIKFKKIESYLDIKDS